ncbi:hypothetical protein VSDG_05253 [Cytospora chrysosperma]|uniref:Uncharacterized protein n=1 Tax=Cytospora chrysosperma TaxID=252740 RepID=A0A423VX33_CYTCH|nr:hypothetical protein VSDG_05253 [Valsa sordida]
MDSMDKWMLAVRRRCNKAPLYTGQDTPTALMNATQWTAQHLHGGHGPWGTEFARQAVGYWGKLQNSKFFQSQRNTEGRGFHNLESTQGREALKNIKDWATTQCFDPMVKGGVYDHITWPQPSQEEIRSELRRLRSLAMDGKHHAPHPHWCTAPRLNIKIKTDRQVIPIAAQQVAPTPREQNNLESARRFFGPAPPQQTIAESSRPAASQDHLQAHQRDEPHPSWKKAVAMMPRLYNPFIDNSSNPNTKTSAGDKYKAMALKLSLQDDLQDQDYPLQSMLERR